MRTRWLVGWCGGLLLSVALVATAQEPVKPADEGQVPSQAGTPPPPRGPRAVQPPGPNPADAARALLDRKIEKQVTLLKAAYELDETTEQQLREELRRRADEQVQFDRDSRERNVQRVKEMRQHKLRGTAETPEERQAFMDRAKARTAQAPLNDARVAEWIEQRLPPEKAQAGHERIAELWQRESREKSKPASDAARNSRIKTSLREDRKEGEAEVTPEGKPLPQGPKGEGAAADEQKESEQAVVHPNENLPPQPAEGGPAVSGANPPEKSKTAVKAPGDSKADPRPPKPEAAGPRPPGAVGPRPNAPAPKAVLLDEWDKYAIQVSERYRFNEAQVAKAKAILADLRRRAYQYQVSRAADFSRVDLITDAKAKQTRLAELNRPMVALFEELKQRLEGLPTSEQRQQAESGKGKPAGKKR